jgi:F0F1-type ATP synthase beta subunit
MHLHTSEFGVHAIDLHTVEENLRLRHRFTLESPITIPEGREVLGTMFNLLRTLKREQQTAKQAAELPLKSTPLFKYLQECEQRFAER